MAHHQFSSYYLHFTFVIKPRNMTLTFIGISALASCFKLQGVPAAQTRQRHLGQKCVFWRVRVCDLTDVGHSVGLPGFNIANGPLSTVSRTE